MMKFTAVFEQANDGSWGGYFPDLPGIIVNGLTRDEVRANAQSGLEFWVECQREEGLPIPTPSVLVDTFEVAA